ncbi:uncharacterized protein sosie [Linepithema humile]|uniref:uncharacterized protein sosie n=1 Tax=Linepithema humile TaxID=83485 RepID=UPI00351E1CAA
MRDEMSLRVITSIVLAISIFSPPMSGALTTFGKSNPQNQNPQNSPPPTPTGKSRECKMDSECAGIQNTTCIADPRDGRTRCLCGDYSVPVNGLCPNKFKALGSPCSDDTDCVLDAYCVQRNNTIGRRCYCREGFVQEAPLICSGCSSMFAMYTTTLLAASLVLGRLGSNI